MNSSSKLIKSQVLYDDQCAFCCFWKGVLSKQDKSNKLDWLALSKATTIMDSYSIPSDINSIVFISENEVLYKSDAIIEVLLKIDKKWASIFKVFPKKFRDNVYSFIARNRNIFE